MARDFPDIVVSTLSNFFTIPANPKDLVRYEAGTTTEEDLNIEELMVFGDSYAGYRDIQ